MIRIAIAEDNDFLAHSIEEKLALFPELKVEFRGRNGAELIGLLEADHGVDVILMDIQMPEMDGIKATSIVKQKYPQIKVIMLTVFDDEDLIFRAIQAGADGYLLKDEGAEKLQKGIVEILDGGAPMSAPIALKTLKLLRDPQPAATGKNYDLTKREIEVLEQLSKGLNYAAIAANLFISTGTVRKHVENTYRKLQVHNKMEAVSLAQREKLI